MFDGSATEAAQREMLRRDVLAGLARRAKAIPSRWLYDERGCALFEEITKLDEYYLTRSEIGILESHRDEIAAFCAGCDVLVEYGTGAGVKSKLLLELLARARVYVPVDIAQEFLEQTAARLRQSFPLLEVNPVVADFVAPFTLPDDIPSGSRLGFFPGSTIGNLSTDESARLLQRLGAQVGAGGRAIIGVDMKKSLDALRAAYDDKEGVTAAFDLNLLVRINRELGANFMVERFRHEARWNEAESAIEMHLRSLASQVVTISGRDFMIEENETIHTESSRKYDVACFRELARAAGWETAHVWTDPRQRFAVLGLVRHVCREFRASSPSARLLPS